MSGDTFSFVLRIWHEAMDERGRITAWHGSIEHVGQGERVYFCDLEEAIQYVQRLVGITGKSQVQSRGDAKPDRGRP